MWLSFYAAEVIEFSLFLEKREFNSVRLFATCTEDTFRFSVSRGIQVRFLLFNDRYGRALLRQRKVQLIFLLHDRPRFCRLSPQATAGNCPLALCDQLEFVVAALSAIGAN